MLDLARHMGVTASTISLTADRLERAGYVRRERSKQDARRVDLRLTPAGVRIKRQQKVLEPDLIAAMLGKTRRETREEKHSAASNSLAEAARELVESGDLQRILKGAAA